MIELAPSWVYDARLPVGREGDTWERLDFIRSDMAFGTWGEADETLAVPPSVAATVGLGSFGRLCTKWQEALGEGGLVARRISAPLLQLCA